MNSVKPITPEEAIKCKSVNFPDEVIASFNELISKNLKGYIARVDQKELVNLIFEKISKNEKYKDITSENIWGHIRKNSWLDIESLYESVGWKVDYEKPAYNENYNAYFEFTR